MSQAMPTALTMQDFPARADGTDTRHDLLLDAVYSAG
jgi:hypothetical protein